MRYHRPKDPVMLAHALLSFLSSSLRLFDWLVEVIDPGQAFQLKHALILFHTLAALMHFSH